MLEFVNCPVCFELYMLKVYLLYEHITQSYLSPFHSNILFFQFNCTWLSYLCNCKTCLSIWQVLLYSFGEHLQCMPKLVAVLVRNFVFGDCATTKWHTVGHANTLYAKETEIINIKIVTMMSKADEHRVFVCIKIVLTTCCIYTVIV